VGVLNWIIIAVLGLVALFFLGIAALAFLALLISYPLIGILLILLVLGFLALCVRWYNNRRKLTVREAESQTHKAKLLGTQAVDQNQKRFDPQTGRRLQ
jgi:uncharacterized membrane protein YbhN (UPF0104 family)